MVVLLVLMPIFFGQVMFAALEKLHLNPDTALLLMIGIFVGGFINLPVRRYARDEWVATDPLAIFGLSGFIPRMMRRRRETVIAVNIGGCVIPAILVIYEVVHVVEAGPGFLGAAAIATMINISICYLVARPIAGVGITMPGLLSPLVAATAALILAGNQAAPIAFIAGVTGPLVGADLLHLREVRNSAVGMASIGGAGTFDGIVLSGIIAAYLA